MKKDKTQISYERKFERGALRAAFVSLFSFAIDRRKAREPYPLQALADGLQIDKSAVSRWFSGNYPNWQIDTIADIADELGIEIRVSAHERATGKIITPHGIADSPQRIVSAPVSMGPAPIILMMQMGNKQSTPISVTARP